MYTNSPFFANVKSGVLGQTVLVQATLSPGTVVSFPVGTTSILATAFGVAGQGHFVRISNESSTTIAATTAAAAADTPVFCVSGTSPTTKMFAAPGTSGAVTVCVAVTVTGISTSLWLTPGTGGFGP